MPFSSLSDPADLARAQGALDIAWRRLSPLIEDSCRDREHARLTYAVEALAIAAFDEEELAERAWKRFWQLVR